MQPNDPNSDQGTDDASRPKGQPRKDTSVPRREATDQPTPEETQ